jgi:CheY-like chemotaxis protein/predicted  nucleic acid-binding Zn-ribbon protein
METAHAATLAARQSQIHRLEDAILAGASRAETQQARTVELQDALAESATRAEESQARMASYVAHIRKLESDAAAAKQQLAEAQTRIGDLEAEIADAYMFGAELQRTHEKKTARVIELEGLLAAANENTRVAALEGALETARSASESLAIRVEELEHAVDTLTGERDQALAKVESNEADWSEKLQTIVTHLASDHEADLGQALLEKEEARAEARSLGARITELKRMIEEKSIAPEHGFAVVNLGAPRKRSVLLIHHDAMLRTMAKHALERSGYKVTTASDGLEALRTAMTEKPDVILADTQMPKMDGRALVQLLKSRSETANMKIILIGAPVAPSQHTDFHADDFLRDPGNIEAMRETIENVLASR